jgi:hypothetical protein
MSEHEQYLTSPADAALDRYLLSLQRVAPRKGFEDRVMARVRIPAPALVRFRQRTRSLLSPRRLWWASGLAAASSTAWTVALVSSLAGLNPQALAASFSAAIAQPLMAMTLQGAALASEAVSFYALAAFSALGNALFAIVAALMFIPVLSTWGLYLTLKQTRGKRIAPYAAR